jgi:hypothetical protein
MKSKSLWSQNLGLMIFLLLFGLNGCSAPTGSGDKPLQGSKERVVVPPHRQIEVSPPKDQP